MEWNTVLYAAVAILVITQLLDENLPPPGF